MSKTLPPLPSWLDEFPHEHREWIVPRLQAYALAAIEAQGVEVKPIEYTPGKWFDAATVDIMQAFFESRLPAIREAAKEHGYAIGLHGSMRRDLDLIAAPWRDGASDPDTLAHTIAMAACGITRDGPHQWEQKPAGRIATSIPICWTHRQGVLSDGHIDLSVMPQKSVSTQADLTAFEAWVKADSTLPLDRDAFGYADMTTALMWHAWQAASTQDKPQPVPQYDQQALELCESCGWKTMIPEEGCMNCERKPLTLDCYDAGLLNDFGGGNVEWWQDYIRAELARAHEFYQFQIKE